MRRSSVPPSVAEDRNAQPSLVELVLAWALSFALLGAEAVTNGQLAFAGVSSFGLVLVPWIALAGMPNGRAGRSGFLPLAFALPPLGLGLGLDYARGLVQSGPITTALVAGTGVALVGLWGLAASAAADARSAQRTYGWLWLVCVPAVAALGVALAWAPSGSAAVSEGANGAWIAGVVRAAPLGWAFAVARSGGAFGDTIAAGLVALGLSVCVWRGVAHLARRDRGEPVR